MGFFDAILGRSKVSKPAADRLFAMATAYVTLQTELNINSTGQAAIVFQPLATSDFNSILEETQALVAGTSSEFGGSSKSETDTFGYEWVIFKDDDFEDLVVNINAVDNNLESSGYGQQLLCAVFAFRDSQTRPLYVIYNYKRGKFYPFVPAANANQERDNERELRLKAQLNRELPIEEELERWFPLWGIPI